MSSCWCICLPQFMLWPVWRIVMQLVWYRRSRPHRPCNLGNMWSGSNTGASWVFWECVRYWGYACRMHLLLRHHKWCKIYRSNTTEFIIECRVKWMTTCFGLFTLIRPSSGQATRTRSRFYIRFCL